MIPAAAATLLARSLAGIGALAVVLGVLGSVVGLFLSFHLNAASGATIIVTLAAAFFAALVLRRGR